jgi:hypothetical protein
MPVGVTGRTRRQQWPQAIICDDPAEDAEWGVVAVGRADQQGDTRDPGSFDRLPGVIDLAGQRFLANDVLTVHSRAPHRSKVTRGW